MNAPDTTFEFVSPCSHTYKVPAVKCTKETGPGCNCGNPWSYYVEDIQCPTCGYRPKFLERPIWTHVGIGQFNPQSILTLGCYQELDEGFFSAPQPVKIL